MHLRRFHHAPRRMHGLAFEPPALLRSNQLGRVMPLRATGRRAPRYAPVVLKRAPRLTAHQRANAIPGVTPPRRHPQAMNGLGWFQAVANIVGAAATIYASEESTKAAKVQETVQAEANAGAIALEQEKRKTMEEQSMLSAKNLATISAFVVPIIGGGVALYFFTRKKRK